MNEQDNFNEAIERWTKAVTEFENLLHDLTPPEPEITDEFLMEQESEGQKIIAMIETVLVMAVLIFGGWIMFLGGYYHGIKEGIRREQNNTTKRVVRQRVFRGGYE